jgi:peptide/nickel transport system permease protein
MATIALSVSVPERRGPMRNVRSFLRDPKAKVSTFVLATFVVLAVFGSHIAPYGVNDQDLSRSLESPSLDHPMGTDQLGRDVLSRGIYGARISVSVGLLAVSIALVTGSALGLLAGFAGRLIDTIVMRFVDAWMSFPPLILILGIVAILGSSLINVMVAVGLASFPVFSRLVRSETLSAKQQDYILAARASGASDARLMLRHVLPNTVQPVVVQASLLVGAAVLAEASLSFLGLGARPPAATWGLIIAEGFPVVRLSPWPTIFPGVFIFLFVLSANFFGDRMRDLLDPKLRGSV